MEGERESQKPDRRSAPRPLTTVRMPWTSPSKTAAMSWSVGEERREGEDQGTHGPSRTASTVVPSAAVVVVVVVVGAKGAKLPLVPVALAVAAAAALEDKRVGVGVEAGVVLEGGRREPWG